MNPLEIAFQVVNVLDVAVYVAVLVFLIIVAAGGGYIVLTVLAVLILSALAVIGAVSVSKRIRGLQVTYIIIQMIKTNVFLLIAYLMVIHLSPAALKLNEAEEGRRITNLMKDYDNNKEELDEMQKSFKCCGTVSFMYKEEGFPTSCCEEEWSCTVPFPKRCETAITELTFQTYCYCLPIMCFTMVMAVALVILVFLIRKRQREESDDDFE
ncbi:Hypothetical protein NTJ_13935 [Nesidiocoris tenuis]|uniref:Tetraspanin n=1 Tax=Nesidiocoris tenuis TaxID=355587 RepID=A0ABN7B9Y7_9HEMI|nr:Hypothetical protein NTJ_13935 [Nesidiocoris tenuis]